MMVKSLHLMLVCMLAMAPALASYEDLHQMVEHQVAAITGRPVSLKISQEGFLRNKLANTPIDAKNLSVTFDAQRNMVQARLTLSPKAPPLLIRGQAIYTLEIPTLITPLATGAIVTEADIGYISVPAHQVNKDTIPAAINLIGLQAKRSQVPNKPLRKGDFMRPILVNKNQLVTVTAKSENLSVTTQAKALEDGGKEEVVRLQNLSSKKTFQGVVTGPARAEITTLVPAHA